MKHFSTGQAAKLLSVTPDAILKWIKRGKLAAVRTAGGHYRISSSAIQPMLDERGHDPQRQPGSTGLGIQSKTPERDGFVHCWEFFSRDGEIREGCTQCVAFKAKAEKCYELSRLPAQSGFEGVLCTASCEKCLYYRQKTLPPVNILLISENKELQSLAGDREKSRFKIRFASCEYECSYLVDTFRPDVVVLACETNLENSRAMCRHLRSDPRIPDVMIITIVPPHIDSANLDFCDGTICIRLEKTVSAETLSSWMDLLLGRIG